MQKRGKWKRMLRDYLRCSMENIPVIDSEETVRSVVDRILRRAGHSVQATGDFDEALRILSHSKADLVVTNVFLNGITGHGAVLRLKTEFPGARVDDIRITG